MFLCNCSFFIKSIPKIVTFFILYYFLHIYIDYLGLYYESGTKFMQYLNQLQRNRYCENHPHSIFNMFKLLYLPEHFYSHNYTNCFRFSIISLNLFICFIFMLLLIYLCFKVQKKIFDILVFIVLFISLFSPLLLSLQKIPEYYTLQQVSPASFSERIPHLFISTYFLGFVIGFTYFYHKDIISQHSLTGNLSKYAPFSFLLSILSLFDRQTYWIKFICTIIVGLLIIIQSSIYYLCFLGNHFQTLKIPYTPFLQVYYKLESPIFKILFTIFMLFILCIIKITPSSPTKGNIFVLANRIGYTFYLTLIHLYILQMHCLYLLQD